ncbi:DUF4974 domain-containing protein [Niastella caeni]|uniref:DUF4974 domain-containing protein n=1 Tax=Niastella caeni TaxID=2569763 RepID=A0A4S8HWB4_9BACT|nr:FecR family protein [Niastella caeni]THU39501.1 DUF4974 domain-containing protein [Niastella caeni]
MTDKAGDISMLIRKHLLGELTGEERSIMNSWISESDENRKVFNELTNEEGLQRALQDLYQFQQTHNINQPASVVDLYHAKTKWLKYIAVVASAIAVVCMVWLLVINNRRDKRPAVTETATKKTNQDIAPGGNKAVLTLADGSNIVLDNIANGTISKQGSTNVVKQADGELAYNTSQSTSPSSHSPLATSYNTVTTPRGGQYQLTLPDGSKVWLNAASSLKFPVSFSGKERVVQLTGEAYFEVAHVTMPGSAERMPFEVEVNNGMKVEVLGTHFNVMAYEDEKESKTTLLQGKVKVIVKTPASVLLKPGQQALLTKANEKVRVDKDANVEEAVAWKNGKFKFVRTDLKTVMRQLARWYDVQVEYDKNLPEKFFTGEIPRRLNASEVLSVIEFAGVHCRIEGKKIIVIP